MSLKLCENLSKMMSKPVFSSPIKVGILIISCSCNESKIFKLDTKATKFLLKLVRKLYSRPDLTWISTLCVSVWWPSNIITHLSKVCKCFLCFKTLLHCQDFFHDIRACHSLTQLHWTSWDHHNLFVLAKWKTVTFGIKKWA